jgi:hypothetical protein
MGARDLFGDLRKRRIARPGILEAVLCNGDRVRAAMPFAYQPSARLQSKARIWSHFSCGPEHFGQSLELAARRLAEPTMFKLLASIGDPANYQIAADPWGLAAVEPPPFAAKLIDTGAVRSNSCASALLTLLSRSNCAEKSPRRRGRGREAKGGAMAYTFGDATAVM